MELWRKTGQKGLLITATRGWKEDSDRAITSVVETVRVPAHLVPPGFPQAKQLPHLHAQLSLGQSCHRQKSLVSIGEQHHFGSVQLFATLYTVACQASLSGGGGGGRFSRQEYWSTLANAGCHTLLERHISCFPSCQVP